MYNNAGKKLMSTVSVITTIMMIVSLIGGIAVGSIVANLPYNEASDGFLPGIIVAATGCIVSWLSNLILATFAEMAMNVAEIAKATGVSNNYAPATDDKGENNNAASIEPWECSSCGQKNAAHVKSCQGCGVSKQWSDTHK